MSVCIHDRCRIIEFAVDYYELLLYSIPYGICFMSVFVGSIVAVRKSCYARTWWFNCCCVRVLRNADIWCSVVVLQAYCDDGIIS